MRPALSLPLPLPLAVSLPLWRPVLAALLATCPLLAQVPCFEPALGTNLNLANDTVAPGLALGFTFPGPGNTNVATIDVADNGFVWLGSNGNARCCDGFGFQFVADGPSIAALWEDLDPTTASGGVFFNTFPAAPGVPARAVVTWSRLREGSQAQVVTAQLQLFDNGGFVITHEPGNDVRSHLALVGVTQGNNATANPIVFSSITGAPLDTGTNPTAYQELGNGSFDLAGRSYEFVPNGNGGYLIFERLQCRAASFARFGTGCPAVAPVSVYEGFQPNTFDLSGACVRGVPNGRNGYLLVPSALTFGAFATNLNLTDDSVSPPVRLPFGFTHPAGRTDVISVSSNGFVWFAPGGADRAFADPTILLSDPPSLCALWMDLNPDLALLNGGVFADADPSGQAFYVTWSGVPEYNNPGSNTFQIALFADGSFELRWQSASVRTHPAVVGYSTGNFAPDPGPLDLSAALPFDTGPGAGPLELDAAPGSLPRLGSTFVLATDRVPAGTGVGLLVLGFRDATIDLTALGMPGCTGYVDFAGGPVGLTVFPIAAVPAPVNIALPNNPALAAMTAFAQTATLSAGFNALGVVASNGLQFVVGR